MIAAMRKSILADTSTPFFLIVILSPWLAPLPPLNGKCERAAF